MPMSSTTRWRSARWSPDGPIRRAGRPPSVDACDLAGDVHVGHRLAAGCVEREGGEAVGVARHHVGEVGGVAVEHQRLRARRGPTSRRAGERWPRSRRGDRGGRPPRAPRWRATDPSASRGERRRRRRTASPRASPATDDDSHGPGSGSRPISSASTTTSSIPSPAPPCASGTSTPVHPISANRRHRSPVYPRTSSSMARTCSPPTSRSRNERAVSRSASCSSLNVKSTAGDLADAAVRFARRGLRLHGGGRGVPRRAAGVARREPARRSSSGRDR